VKDLLDTAGVRTTAGSALFKDRVPQQDAEVVRRLKAAGAVLLGKLNMHEFAFGASSAFSYFGAVRNPWNLAYSPEARPADPPQRSRAGCVTPRSGPIRVVQSASRPATAASWA